MKTETAIAGVQFRPKAIKEAIRLLAPGDQLELERDPENAFDPNAIKIMADGQFLGFVQKQVAAYLAPELDTGAAHTCEVKSNENGLPVCIIQPA